VHACGLRRLKNYLYLYLLLLGDREVSCIKQKAATNEFYNYPTTEECSKTNVMSHIVDITKKKKKNARR
jgi:phosphoribosylaminoimidazole carboxylase (NCAIR synthetase)